MVSRWGEPALAFATLWAFLVYLVGAAWYLRANREPIAATVRALTANPGGAREALNGAGPLQSGVEFVAASVQAGSSGLFFAVGAALVTITLFATVVRHPARWRHPAWWALPGLGAGPAAGLVLQSQLPTLASPMLVALVCFGVAPIAALVGWIGFLYSRL